MRVTTAIVPRRECRSGTTEWTSRGHFNNSTEIIGLRGVSLKGSIWSADAAAKLLEGFPAGESGEQKGLDLFEALAIGA